MELQIAPAVQAARTRLGGAWERARAHSFWFQLVTVSALAFLAALALGWSASRQAATWRAQEETLLDTRAGLARWERAFQPAVPAESASWRASRVQVEALGPAGAAPLTVARQVAERAEQLGTDELRIALVEADSGAVPQSVGVGPLTVRADRSAISVQLRGDLQSVLDFVGVLPPRVEVGRLRLSRRAGGEMSADVTLFIRVVTQGG